MGFDNADMKIDGTKLVITVDLAKDYGPSASSGKLLLVANTHGWQGLPGTEGFKINLCIGKPNAEYVAPVKGAKK
jgi:hypothetical protein